MINVAKSPDPVVQQSVRGDVFELRVTAALIAYRGHAQFKDVPQPWRHAMKGNDI